MVTDNFAVVPEAYRVLSQKGNSVEVRLRDAETDLWAVVAGGGLVVGVDGYLDYEPQPSSRTEDWLRRHRFPLQQAIEVAKQYLIVKESV